MHNGNMRSGQALIVVLMLMAVLVSVGLSVASRSVTEVHLSSTEQESARALSAAEAGVETVLNKTLVLVSTPYPVNNNTDQTFTVKELNVPAGSGNRLDLPDSLRSGDTATIYLSGVPTDRAFDICWGDPDLSDPSPALQVAVYYQNGGFYYVARQVWDRPGGIQNAQNPTTPTNSNNNCPHTREFRSLAKDVTLNQFIGSGGGSPVFMRLTLLKNPSLGHHISVGSNNLNFPNQGIGSTVTGQSGQANKAVQIFERTPAPLAVFDYALFSGGGIQ